MSVTPFDTAWNPSKLINNVHAVLVTCGSLLALDEQQGTVHLIHPSVEQFLTSKFRGNEFEFDREDAEIKTTEVIVTYLNYNVFDRQISRAVVPSLLLEQAPDLILAFDLTPSRSVRFVVLHMLRSSRKSNFDVGKGSCGTQRSIQIA